MKRDTGPVLIKFTYSRRRTEQTKSKEEADRHTFREILVSAIQNCMGQGKRTNKAELELGLVGLPVSSLYKYRLR